MGRHTDRVRAAGSTGRARRAGHRAHVRAVLQRHQAADQQCPPPVDTDARRARREQHGEPGRGRANPRGHGLQERLRQRPDGRAAAFPGHAGPPRAGCRSATGGGRRSIHSRFARSRFASSKSSRSGPRPPTPRPRLGAVVENLEPGVNYTWRIAIKAPGGPDRLAPDNVPGGCVPGRCRSCMRTRQPDDGGGNARRRVALDIWRAASPRARRPLSSRSSSGTSARINRTTATPTPRRAAV